MYLVSEVLLCTVIKTNLIYYGPDDALFIWKYDWDLMRKDYQIFPPKTFLK